MQIVRKHTWLKLIGLALWIIMANYNSFAQVSNPTNIAYNDASALGQLDSVQLLKLINAADAGDVAAQNLLGNYYLNQYPDTIAIRKGIQYFQQAALQNYAPSQHNLFIIYQEPQLNLVNHDSAIFWLRKSANNGYAQAQNNL